MSGPSSSSSAPAQRDMSQVRAAYRTGDVSVTIAQHAKTVVPKAEVHGGEGSEFLKSIVFGGLDGILTVFAVVAAGVGGGDELGRTAILIFGFANLFADGFAMGFGEYTSSKAELEHVTEELKREEWEFQSFPEGERQEMIDLYTQKGLSAKDATRFIDLLMLYPNVFINRMMVDELGLMVPEDASENVPAKNGLVVFLSFVCFGVIPLLGFLPNWSDSTALLVSCLLTALCLAILGGFKGHLVKAKPLTSALNMVLTGSFAAITSYYLSVLISHMLPPDQLTGAPVLG